MKFARTMMDLANYNFNTERTNSVISFYKNNYSQQVMDTFSRFHSGSLSGENARRRFEGDISTVMEFYAQRYNYAERTTRSAMGLSAEPHRLTVVNSSENGSIQLNTLKLGNISSWSGKYHPDYDIHLTAVPVEGKTFSHWNLNGATLTDGDQNSAAIKIRIDSDVTVEAVYGSSSQTTTATTTSKTTVTTTKTTSTTSKATTTIKTTASTTKPTTATTAPKTTTTSTNRTTAPVTTVTTTSAKASIRKLGKVIQAESFDYNSGKGEGHAGYFGIIWERRKRDKQQQKRDKCAQIRDRRAGFFPYTGDGG